MSKLNEFGVYLKPGKNMKTFSQGSQYFKEKRGVDVIKYRFTLETPRRRKLAVNQDALTKCEICGTKLYRYLSPNEMGIDTDKLLGNHLYVEHKRHLVFYDTNNVAHKTCIRLNHCFRRVDYESDSDWSKRIFSPVSASEFSGMQPSTKDEQIFFEGYKYNYDYIVIPFIVKWANSEITKNNLIEFQKEFDEMQSKHLPFYDGDKEKRQAVKKILTMIGVTNE